MKVRKINNVPRNISALVVGKDTPEQAEKSINVLKFIIIAVLAGTVILNYKYYTGKI